MPVVPKLGEQGIGRQQYRLVCDYRNLYSLDLNPGRELRARLSPSGRPEASSGSSLVDVSPLAPLDQYSWPMPVPIPSGSSTDQEPNHRLVPRAAPAEEPICLCAPSYWTQQMQDRMREECPVHGSAAREAATQRDSSQSVGPSSYYR